MPPGTQNLYGIASLLSAFLWPSFFPAITFAPMKVLHCCNSQWRHPRAVKIWSPRILNLPITGKTTCPCVYWCSSGMSNWVCIWVLKVNLLPMPVSQLLKQIHKELSFFIVICISSEISAPTSSLILQQKLPGFHVNRWLIDSDGSSSNRPTWFEFSPGSSSIHSGYKIITLM